VDLATEDHGSLHGACLVRCGAFRILMDEEQRRWRWGGDAGQGQRAAEQEDCAARFGDDGERGAIVPGDGGGLAVNA